MESSERKPTKRTRVLQGSCPAASGKLYTSRPGGLDRHGGRLHARRGRWSRQRPLALRPFYRRATGPAPSPVIRLADNDPSLRCRSLGCLSLLSPTPVSVSIRGSSAFLRRVLAADFPDTLDGAIRSCCEPIAAGLASMRATASAIMYGGVIFGRHGLSVLAF